ncbi:MAG: (2Fe-2S) ferredoxin domain-containing protein [Cyanobacteria bacterium]|nr:(2Fe-2S) ferredoxin domain-containing protein [Cyanobacteriota bacterium]MDW8200335.1 (2Fe-2S) ferredoxin domain-containing protein [Cyanobacteriota bacterium SKYGB_h_bin112]
MNQLDSYSRIGFNFEGQFLGFVRRDGTPKYLRLRVLSEEMLIKLPKVMRLAWGSSLQPGDLLRVTGIGKVDRHTLTLKLKAAQITPLTTNRLPQSAATELTNPANPTFLEKPDASHQPHLQSTKAKPKVKVLVCQKSDCLKRGGNGLCEALGKALRDRRVDQYVTIERTGCLKRCASAPNLVVIPGNHRYTEVRLKNLSQIADAIASQLAIC